MMERSDIIIANLTPFAGTSADAGTVGRFLGRGKSAGQLACGRAIA
jgi:nucleoside 2-deoxyribosyltransferase